VLVVELDESDFDSDFDSDFEVLFESLDLEVPELFLASVE
jgi:hypothetical protein